jgi:NADH-quinone oxidoreductase subunit L
LAWLVFLKKRIDPVAFGTDHPRLYSFLYNKWYFDEVYDADVVFPMRRFAMYLWTVIDEKVIDGTLMGVARGVEEFSQGLRTLQTGLVRNYALAIALGMVVIVGVYFAAFSDLFR